MSGSRSRTHIVLHGDPTEGDGQDAGHVEDLCSQVGDVGERENHQGLQDSGLQVVSSPARPTAAHMVHEACSEGRQVANDDPYDSSSSCNHQEADLGWR